MKLLTQNTKLKKNPEYLVYGLDLAPHKTSGYNTCKFAGACSDICVGVHSGFNKMPAALQAKIRKTKLFFQNRRQFLELLHQDLQCLEKSKDKRRKFVRLNVDSDIPWESVDKTIFDYNIDFYDYTKYFQRVLDKQEGKLPSNYALTYSWNEFSDKVATKKFLKKGGNINVVIDLPYHKFEDVPSSAKIDRTMYDLVDGDLSDIRHPDIDGEGKVVVVRAKSRVDQIKEYVGRKFIVTLKNNKLLC